VEDFVVEVEGDDFSDDEAAGDGLAEVDDLVEFAFEADGRGSNLGWAHDLRGARLEVGELKFVHAMLVLATGDVHALGEVEGDHVDDEFAGVADVEERALGLGSVGKAADAGREAEHGRGGGNGVEEGERSEVGGAVFAERGDPGDGPRANSDEERAVEFALGDLVGAEVHGSSLACRAKVWIPG